MTFTPPFLRTGLAELSRDYDAFIIDLWGVMHDGVTAFPDALACLRELKQADKSVAILSNAPRRAASVAARNADLGIPAELADLVWSSGEATWRHLEARPDAWYRKLGRRCFHLGPERDQGMRVGLDYDFVEDIAGADFFLDTGILDSGHDLTHYRDLLGTALARGLPMVCANPDLEVIRGGRRELCAGAVAQAYADLGGEVRFHGKPDPLIYDDCLQRLGGPARDRVLAIGDSLRTDIAGAARAGINSVFVADGIHGEALGLEMASTASPPPPDLEARLRTLFADAGLAPRAALVRLSW